MELTITYQGENVGTLQIKQQGLYYEYTAKCTVCPSVPMRLYAVNAFEIKPIGVLMKNGEMKKRISVRETAVLPDRVILGNAENDYYPWSGTIEGENISDAYLCQEASKMQLAMPVMDGGEVPLLAYASEMKPITICGRQCLVLPLHEGKPMSTKQEATEEYEEKDNYSDVSIDEFL